MFEKDTKSCEPKYVSCIKVNGIPILPPLITHAKRKEIHRYKQQAMKLEKRLRRERELRQYIDRYYTPNLENCTNILVTSSLEHRLSFEDDLISQINDFENEIKEIQGKKCTVTNQVPSVIQKKTPCLSCDLQVSQYANNEFTVLTSFGKCNSDIVAISEPLCKDKEDSFAIQRSPENEVDISDSESRRPRLIRSNSYTLESPSPMLLEHLRKQTKSADDGLSPFKISHDDMQNIAESDRQLSNILAIGTKDGYVYQEVNGHLDNSSYTNFSKTESDLRNISTSLSDQISPSEDFTLIGSEYQLKAFIDNNVPQVLDKEIIQTENSNETEDPSNHNKDGRVLLNNTSNSSPNTSIILPREQLTEYCEGDLKQILHDIPEIYSKQILEFLEKQKQGLSLKMKETHDLHLYEAEEIFDKIEGSGFISQGEPMSHLNYDPSEIIETEIKSARRIRSETALNCSRELFPICDTKNGERSSQNKKEYAASIIGAAVKGYLVRRLMRTDRVQGLIETIKDALICAMQLHSENSDSINESDVELHRRLIQQVSAACYEFHDVFFALNISEQMTIIRVDRERQKEKLKRPFSRVSSARSSRTSRSMTKSFEN